MFGISALDTSALYIVYYNIQEQKKLWSESLSRHSRSRARGRTVRLRCCCAALVATSARGAGARAHSYLYTVSRGGWIYHNPPALRSRPLSYSCALISIYYVYVLLPLPRSFKACDGTSALSVYYVRCICFDSKCEQIFFFFDVALVAAEMDIYNIEWTAV